MVKPLSQWDSLNADSTSDTQEFTRELVDAVSELNRSVTHLNRALAKLQRKLTAQAAELEKAAPPNQLH